MENQPRGASAAAPRTPEALPLDPATGLPLVAGLFSDSDADSSPGYLACWRGGRAAASSPASPPLRRTRSSPPHLGPRVDAFGEVVPSAGSTGAAAPRCSGMDDSMGVPRLDLSSTDEGRRFSGEETSQLIEDILGRRGGESLQAGSHAEEEEFRPPFCEEAEAWRGRGQGRPVVPPLNFDRLRHGEAAEFPPMPGAGAARRRHRRRRRSYSEPPPRTSGLDEHDPCPWTVSGAGAAAASPWATSAGGIPNARGRDFAWAGHVGVGGAGRPHPPDQPWVPRKPLRPMESLGANEFGRLDASSHENAAAAASRMPAIMPSSVPPERAHGAGFHAWPAHAAMPPSIPAPSAAGPVTSNRPRPATPADALRAAEDLRAELLASQEDARMDSGFSRPRRAVRFVERPEEREYIAGAALGVGAHRVAPPLEPPLPTVPPAPISSSVPVVEVSGNRMPAGDVAEAVSAPPATNAPRRGPTTEDVTAASASCIAASAQAAAAALEAAAALAAGGGTALNAEPLVAPGPAVPPAGAYALPASTATAAAAVTSLAHAPDAGPSLPPDVAHASAGSTAGVPPPAPAPAADAGSSVFPAVAHAPVAATARMPAPAPVPAPGAAPGPPPAPAPEAGAPRAGWQPPSAPPPHMHSVASAPDAPTGTARADAVPPPHAGAEILGPAAPMASAVPPRDPEPLFSSAPLPPRTAPPMFVPHAGGAAPPVGPGAASSAPLRTEGPMPPPRHVPAPPGAFGGPWPGAPPQIDTSGAAAPPVGGGHGVYFPDPGFPAFPPTWGMPMPGPLPTAPVGGFPMPGPQAGTPAAGFPMPVFPPGAAVGGFQPGVGTGGQCPPPIGQGLPAVAPRPLPAEGRMPMPANPMGPPGAGLRTEGPMPPPRAPAWVPASWSATAAAGAIPAGAEAGLGGAPAPGGPGVAAAGVCAAPPGLGATGGAPLPPPAAAPTGPGVGGHGVGGAPLPPPAAAPIRPGEGGVGVGGVPLGPPAAASTGPGGGICDAAGLQVPPPAAAPIGLGGGESGGGGSVTSGEGFGRTAAPVEGDAAARVPAPTAGTAPAGGTGEHPGESFTGGAAPLPAPPTEFPGVESVGGHEATRAPPAKPAASLGPGAAPAPPGHVAGGATAFVSGTAGAAAKAAGAAAAGAAAAIAAVARRIAGAGGAPTAPGDGAGGAHAPGSAPSVEASVAPNGETVDPAAPPQSGPPDAGFADGARRSADADAAAAGAGATAAEDTTGADPGSQADGAAAAAAARPSEGARRSRSRGTGSVGGGPENAPRRADAADESASWQDVSAPTGWDATFPASPVAPASPAPPLSPRLGDAADARGDLADYASGENDRRPSDEVSGVGATAPGEQPGDSAHTPHSRIPRSPGMALVDDRHCRTPAKHALVLKRKRGPLGPRDFGISHFEVDIDRFPTTTLGGRPRRARIQPLRRWLHERLLYERKPDSKLPTVKSVIIAQENKGPDELVEFALTDESAPSSPLAPIAPAEVPPPSSPGELILTPPSKRQAQAIAVSNPPSRRRSAAGAPPRTGPRSSLGRGRGPAAPVVEEAVAAPAAKKPRREPAKPDSPPEKRRGRRPARRPQSPAPLPDGDAPGPPPPPGLPDLPAGFFRAPLAEGSQAACELYVGDTHGKLTLGAMNIPPKSFSKPDILPAGTSFYFYVMAADPGALWLESDVATCLLKEGDRFVVEPERLYSLRNNSEKNYVRMKMVVVTSQIL